LLIIPSSKFELKIPKMKFKKNNLEYFKEKSPKIEGKIKISSRF